MTKQEVRGKAKKLSGKVKEAAGILTGNEALEARGADQRVEGTIEEGVGKARRKVGNLVADVAKAIKE